MKSEGMLAVKIIEIDRQHRTCPTSRQGALRGGVAAKAPDYLSYVHLVGTDL